jgi:hypothetical protein
MLNFLNREFIKIISEPLADDFPVLLGGDQQKSFYFGFHKTLLLRECI